MAKKPRKTAHSSSPAKRGRQEANGQIAPVTWPLPPGATHQIRTDRTGKKRLDRKRFSAT